MMKTKRIALISALIAGIAMLLVLCSCGTIKLDKPLFCKSLIYAEDMDFDLPYLCDKNWDKTIDSISIPGAAPSISCQVYGESKESYKGAELRTAECGINFGSLLDDNGNIPKDFTFDKVEVQWSDGSKTTENIGQITVMGNVPELNYERRVSLSTDDSINGENTTNTAFKEFELCNKAGLIQSGTASKLNDAFETLSVNDTPIADIIESDKPIQVPEEQITYAYSLNKVPVEIYNTINVELVVKYKNPKNKTRYTTISVNSTDNINMDILAKTAAAQ